MVIERGRVCWLAGDRPAARRPVLVLQSDPFNRSRIPTVLVAPMAQDLRLAEAPGNVLLRARDTGLPRDTILVVSQVASVERGRLQATSESLDLPLMTEVTEGLRLALGL